MMNNNIAPIPPDAAKATAGTTAQHMADALSFLMRVAAEAGMGTIAAKLAHVRINLLNYSDADEEAASPEQGDSPALKSTREDRDEKRKLC
jgi:hypothetical protein